MAPGVPRKILHLDLDAFFCAVEELRDPGLVGKPFAVGGSPQTRGVVASCSYAARQRGVRSAMPMATAIRLCPELVIVPSRHGVYGQTSRQVMARLHDVTPLVEQISIDEAFLDASDLPEPGEALARRLQATIREELGLPCSLGVATNKLVAKIANDAGKAANRGSGPPNAITVVPPGQEAVFLAPLPVQALWGIGPKTAARLHEWGLTTIGDLAAWPEPELVRRLGVLGHELAQRSRGLDDRPVVVEHETKSVSKEVTFARDIAEEASLQRALRQLADGVGRELRREGLSGRTIKLKLRWSDFTTISRQTTLPQPTDMDDEIAAAALKLFAQAWTRGKPVRLLGVGVSGLDSAYRQLGLWDQEEGDERKLQAALDDIRSRFGIDAVRRGSALGSRREAGSGWDSH